MIREPNKKEVSTAVKSFEDIKHVDEEGKEYWNARELSKAMGYSRYRNFEPALDRARQQMVSTGKNPEEHMAELRHPLKTKNQYGAEVSQEVKDIKLDKYAAYNVSMNADPSKTEVAFAQEYFLQNTAKAEAISKRLKDRATIINRNNLREANRSLNAEVLTRDVEPEEIGIVLSAGDKGFFNMSTKEIKEEFNIPTNRPVADFMSLRETAYKTVAQINSEQEIEKHNLHGVKDISEAVYDENRKMREMYIDKFESTPEKMLPGEDVKKLERKYNKFTAKQLKLIEQEC